MSAYDDLIQLLNSANQGAETYKGDCEKLAKALATSVRDTLGWPEDKFELLKAESDDVPEGCQWTRSGWYEPDGKLKFGFVMSLGQLHMQIAWLVWRGADSWHISSDEKSWKVRPESGETFKPLIEYVASSWREFIEKATFKDRWS